MAISKFSRNDRCKNLGMRGSALRESLAFQHWRLSRDVALVPSPWSITNFWGSFAKQQVLSWPAVPCRSSLECSLRLRQLRSHLELEAEEQREKAFRPRNHTATEVEPGVETSLDTAQGGARTHECVRYNLKAAKSAHDFFFLVALGIATCRISGGGSPMGR